AESFGHWITDDAIHIKAVIRDATPFAHQLVLEREYICSLSKNEIVMNDVIKNVGSTETPFELLYHCNMGYPLLSENSHVTINNKGVVPRNEEAEKGLCDALKMEKPQAGYEEQCFFYDMTEGLAKISNPEIGVSLSLNYDVRELPCFTEWKMMGSGQYALGLEPGNVTPEGRDVMRKKGTLTFLAPGEEKTQTITIKLSREG
ncbi:MAG: DUF4432 family protein, partial [Oscillospiraceae bacterium]|nr:DUF4432 family protein [Oscillospiraceae bacterium]